MTPAAAALIIRRNCPASDSLGGFDFAFHLDPRMVGMSGIRSTGDLYEILEHWSHRLQHWSAQRLDHPTGGEDVHTTIERLF